MLKTEEVLAQSKAAMAQWGPTWEKHATRNGELFKKLGHSHKELLFKGAGRTLVICGMGPSLETQIDTLKKYQDNPAVDIMCVDKAMGFLLDRGVTPKWVNIADAGIDYNRWCEKNIEKTRDIHLLSNITANPEWTHNWRYNQNENNIWFYVNRDNIQSEKIYSAISGCNDLIHAGSNVGNSCVIFAASILGYEEILLLGFDFAWRYEDNYYAFADEKEIGTNKRGWMRHMMQIDKSGNVTNTSQNLNFSARWLSDYYNLELKQFGIKIFDCSKTGILFGVPDANLESKMQHAEVIKIDDARKNTVFNAIMQQRTIAAQEGPEALNEVLSENNVVNITVNYITKDQDVWLQSI